MTAQGRILWYELITADIERAVGFYTAVLPWQVGASVQPHMDYRLIQVGQAFPGGIMARPDPQVPTGWLAYVHVDDVDAARAAVIAAGGRGLMEPMHLPNVGRFALVADPHGAAFYVMTPEGQGPSTAFAPGKPGHGGWNELHTDAPEAGMAFYTHHFGWEKLPPMDMGPNGLYHLFAIAGTQAGGMAKPAGPHKGWLYYFNVESIDAAKGRVEAAGGQVAIGPHEVPGPLWILICQDPEGVAFALVGPK